MGTPRESVRIKQLSQAPGEVRVIVGVVNYIALLKRAQ
jgi:hypothetical protein